MTHRRLLAFSFLPLFIACAAHTDRGGDAGSAAGTDAGPGSGSAPTAVPPSPGPANPTTGTANVVIAIDKLFLGDTDPDGTEDHPNGWTHFGYNIDGVSSGNSSGFCLPVDNASPASVHQEGVGGIENTWGHLILPVYLGLEADAPQQINNLITNGTTTTLFSLGNLGTGASYNPITGQIYMAAMLGSTPAFDGTDMWPVSSASLVNPSDITQGALQTSATGYLVGNTWVSGASRNLTVTVTLPSTGAAMAMDITQAVVTMTLDSTHTTVTNGIISGILVTQDLEQAITTASGQADSSVCGSPTLMAILTQFAQASDILQDGTQDPSMTCDGISIGLGFTGHVDQLGGITPAPAPPANPCAMDGGL